MHNAEMDTTIELQANLLQYLPNAMSDHFLDGTFASYDVSILNILTPASLVGQQLKIYHGEPPPPDSVWRAVGKTLAFKINPSLLSSQDYLFAAAVSDLRVIDAN